MDGYSPQTCKYVIIGFDQSPSRGMLGWGKEGVYITTNICKHVVYMEFNEIYNWNRR